ncbi:hypothetical protein [Flavobacterium noncentrifugens]|uniref:Uncharacterized protein n=1 Tax=Flavobacterium noncentrifugens TaxID=1128970 RepID=A0A1G8UZ72_9FLAO|nr:hypothetical protein [Flavobacterium noncentrifugens]SDJ59118.1 hypothetical protein SAMN04487935_1115 [Flavobacterium noncentrifugens]
MNIDIERLLKNKALDFKCEISTSTAEIFEEVITADYRTCEIKIITKHEFGKCGKSKKKIQHVEFSGSVHKLWNHIHEVKAPNHDPKKRDKGFNGNLFTYCSIAETRQHLMTLFGCTASQMIFQNVEFGVNVEPAFNPRYFIDGLLFHQNIGFQYDYEGNYAQVRHQRYLIKIYFKSWQYGMTTDTLRIEVKYTRMQDLKSIGVRTFEDIVPDTLEKAAKMLLIKFEEIVAYDYSIRNHELSKKDRSLLTQFANPRYWLRDISAKYRDRPKKKLKKIIEQHSDNLQKQILKEIEEKCVTINRHCDECKCVTINSSILGVSIQPRGVFDIAQSRSTTVCSVTGLDISMQRADSILLSHTGLKFYREKEPGVFSALLEKYLSPLWRYASPKKQIKELAHNIRNVRSNQQIRQRQLYPDYQPTIFRLSAIANAGQY